MEAQPIIRNLSQFLEILSKYRDQFAGKYGRDNFMFRGMSDKEWKLLPGIFREYSKSQRATCGIDAEIAGRIYYDNESNILAHFRKEASGILPLVPQNNELLWMQYAQHYGAPTRLLDFTTNPLVSLYFCCQSNSETDGAIWIINIPTFEYWSTGDEYCQRKIPEYTTEMGVSSALRDLHGDPYELAHEKEPGDYKERPLFFVPPYIDQRMAAQSSRFLLWAKNHSALEDMVKTDNWMILDPNGCAVERSDDERFLGKILVSATSKKDILKELDMLNINNKSIYPGLDSIGRYVEQYYKRNIDDILGDSRFI